MAGWTDLAKVFGQLFRRGGAEITEEICQDLLEQANLPGNVLPSSHSHLEKTERTGSWHGGQVPPDSKATPKPHDFLVETYDPSQRGLPHFSYSPVDDLQPDPGEVVWMWIPYQEDPFWGKDRPVLVVGYGQENGQVVHNQVVVAPLTSKDHSLDSSQEAAEGRYWVNIGRGPWDNYRKESDIRLNRLLIADIKATRRIGGTLDPKVFQTVIKQIKHYYY